ncbi:MAG: hypothetical protein U1F87_15740 [Kiritimatiellia bacterium]
MVAAPAEEKEHVPSPEELAALASAREAGDRIRACQAGLLATNDVIRALAQKAEDARRALHEQVLQTPAYQDLTQRIARAEARIQELTSTGGTNSVGRLNNEVRTLRNEMLKDRRQVRLLELGKGLDGGDFTRLKLAVAEAAAELTRALNSHEEVVPLLREHHKAVEAYQKASAPPPPPRGDASGRGSRSAPRPRHPPPPRSVHPALPDAHFLSTRALRG